MADKSKIEWTDATWNPLRARRTYVEQGKPKTRIGWHCERVSDGCRHCYAERLNIDRFGTQLAYKPGNVGLHNLDLYLDQDVLLKPLSWKRPRMIFPCSMTDMFGDWVTDEQLDQMFAVMALAPHHTFQVLTKRAERMQQYLTARNGMGNSAICRAINLVPNHLGNRRGALSMPLGNVWIGVSAEHQKEADERIPHLLQTPAAVRFISAEPLLGPIDLDAIVRNVRLSASITTPAATASIDWVIAGGESGPQARPTHPDWVRGLRDQCGEGEVSFFFKQWGEWAPGECATSGGPTRTEKVATFYDENWDNPGWSFGSLTPQQSREIHRDDEPDVYRLGKKKAGRLLDGVEHSAMPTVLR